MANPPDTGWEVDLLWEFLHENKDSAQSTGDWYKLMDPAGKLNNRQGVYEMLKGVNLDTNPANQNDVEASMIPWNQQNSGIVKRFKSKLACGSLVKLTFQKYMRWGKKEPIRYRGRNPVKWIVDSLNNRMPVRAHLQKKNHYVGIVGYRRRSVPPGDAKTDPVRFEFLIIDPWGGGSTTAKNTIDYGGSTTKFLGIAHEDGSKLTYDSYEITGVEGFYPF